MQEFIDFLKKIEQSSFEINTTAAGNAIISQSQRNELRKEGQQKMMEGIKIWLADHPEFSVLETKDGIIVAVENKDFTFSWEIKCSIKSLDYDPFIEAGNFDDAQAQKAAKKERIAKEKEARIAKIKEKREKKIQEMENKKNEE